MTRHQFPLFQSHLDLAHSYWKTITCPGDCVIDATCGNGHDTLLLAQLVTMGRVIAIDRQQEAIEAAKKLLSTNILEEKRGLIDFKCQSHATFPSEIKPESIKLIVYNLGYLPGGDKNLTTLTSTTCESLENALKLICPGGAISITCYPGHPEGKLEEEALLTFSTSLSPKEWSCCHHRWTNRLKSPSILFIQRHLFPAQPGNKG